MKIWTRIERGKKDLGLEMMWSLRGKARECIRGMDVEEAEKEDGVKEIMKRLERVYKKDALADQMKKAMEFMEIRRKKGENMRDYVIRFERGHC